MPHAFREVEGYTFRSWGYVSVELNLAKINIYHVEFMCLRF